MKGYARMEVVPYQHDTGGPLSPRPLTPLTPRNTVYSATMHSGTATVASAPIFDMTPDAIAAHAAETMATLVQAYDDVAGLALAHVMVTNTVEKLIDVESYISERVSNLVILLHASPHNEIRMACGLALGQFMAVNSQQSMRLDSYLVMKQLEADATALVNCSREHKRYLARATLTTERSGVHLDDDTRDEIADAEDEIATQQVLFGQHLADWTVELSFSAAQLDGLSDEYLADLPKDEHGQYKILLTHATVFPILSTCTVPETRQQVEFAYHSRCSDTNTQVLEELVTLRHKRATLLGYENHAQFVLQECMAKSPEAVQTFLSELSDKLTPLAEKEMDALLALKKDECEARGIEFDGKVHMWDYRYYQDQYVKKHCSIDSEKIREFFPLDHVTTELFAMYEELLSLTFVEVLRPHVWHEEVRKFAVHDAREGRDDRLMGYFYIDLFPRPNKVTNAGCMVLQPSSVKSNGHRTLPVVALLVNFSRPTELRPSLLSHAEVVTFFNEFGHVMHSLCSETTTALLSGTNVEKDFGEMPSKMLENWCWETEPLQRLSSHYATNEPLTLKVIARLQSTRYANKALQAKRQILLATFDQQIHSVPHVDTAALFAKLHDEIQGIPMTPGTNFAASFGHIVTDYDAQYYGYLWSEVFAMDLFQSRFKKEGLMNPTTGLAYREIILARGGSVDASDMLKAFLCREPNQHAFVQSIRRESEP